MKVKDLETLEVFDTDNSEEFFEAYSNPQNLVLPRVWYCDGSGWNGSVSRECFGVEGDLKVLSYPFKLSNNEAEYSAVLSAMIKCDRGDIIRSDSELVVKQILGTYECRADNLKPYLIPARRLLYFRKLTLEWIPREDNLAGIEIERVQRLPHG